MPAALALAQHCRRAVRLPAHDRRASSTLQGQAAVGTYPRTQRGPSTFGKKVNGRRIIGASRKSLFRNSFWSPRTCSDYPPDETWRDRVEWEFIPAGRQGSPRRRGNMRPNAATGFLRIPRLLVVNGCIGNAGNYIYEDKAKKFKFRVQSGPLLIIAQPAFRGVGATSSSISAPATPCRVGGYYRRTGRTPDPAAVSPARSPNVAGARNSVNNDTTQG